MCNRTPTKHNHTMNNKHALITGGNKGIGLETTKMLLDLGYKVTIIARDFSTMETLDNCTLIPFDLQNTEDIPKLIAKIDKVDVLINNAGIMNTCTYDDYSPSSKEALMNINIDAPVALITALAEQMIEQEHGRIVNVASIAGQIGHPDIWYGISKAGVINMTKSFAKILGKHGIIINAIAPSIVETDMKDCIPATRQAEVLKSVFSGRFAKASEIAQTIVWLATESPAYINGTCIDINNGSFPR